MKYFFGKITALLAVTLLASAAHAGPIVGWQTFAKGSNGMTTQTIAVSGPTYGDCMVERQNAIDSLISMGFSFGIVAPNCTPVSLGIPKEILYWEEIRWPWPGPICLSCPLFSKDFIELVYPQHVDLVSDLVRQYQIDSYNQELMELQKRYDLEGFEKEVFRVELEQNFGGKNIKNLR